MDPHGPDTPSARWTDEGGRGAIGVAHRWVRGPWMLARACHGRGGSMYERGVRACEPARPPQGRGRAGSTHPRRTGLFRYRTSSPFEGRPARRLQQHPPRGCPRPAPTPRGPRQPAGPRPRPGRPGSRARHSSLGQAPASPGVPAPGPARAHDARRARGREGSMRAGAPWGPAGVRGCLAIVRSRRSRVAPGSASISIPRAVAPVPVPPLMDQGNPAPRPCPCLGRPTPAPGTPPGRGPMPCQEARPPGRRATTMLGPPRPAGGL